MLENRRRKLIDWLTYIVFALQFSLVVVLVLGGIIFLVVRNSLPAFAALPLRGFLLDPFWNPTAYGQPTFGLLPMLVSTLMLTAGSLVIAVPLGIGAAAYLAEVARPWQREILKPVIEVLAGIPSVVFGFIGLVVLSPFLARTFNLPHGLNALNGSILLGVMSLPTVATLAEDALNAVPRDYREASLALGATRWQTLLRVTGPAAGSGIAAAVMMGVGRSIGETMAVLMAAGNALALPGSLLDPVRAMTATIAIELGEVPFNSLHYYSLYVVGLVLLLLTLLVNLVSEWILSRYQGKTGR